MEIPRQPKPNGHENMGYLAISKVISGMESKSEKGRGSWEVQVINLWDVEGHRQKHFCATSVYAYLRHRGSWLSPAGLTLSRGWGHLSSSPRKSKKGRQAGRQAEQVLHKFSISDIVMVI